MGKLPEKRRKKQMRYRPTDRPTDQPTDQPTNKAAYREACMRQKIWFDPSLLKFGMTFSS